MLIFELKTNLIIYEYIDLIKKMSTTQGLKSLKYDERNLGGRNQIRQGLLNHHNAIINAKSGLNTFERPPKHVDINLSPKHKLLKNKLVTPSMDEVFTGFKKIANAKKYVDNELPEKYMKKKTLPNYKKQNDYINQQHALNLQSQQRRIGSIGKSMHERKKNEFDPIAHPSVFFRKSISDNKDLELDFMFSTVTGTKKTAQTQNLNSLKNKITQRPLSVGASRINFNAQNNDFRRSETIKSEIPSKISETTIKSKKSKSILDLESPIFTVNNDNDYRIIKQTIIDLLIEHRIYKNQDLELLIRKIKDKNHHLNAKKLDEIYLQVTYELDR